MDMEQLRSRMSEDVAIYADRVMSMYEAPFARAMGIEIESIEKDRVVCSMVLAPSMMNSMGRGHGAAVYALIDHCFAIATNMLADGTGQSTEVKFREAHRGGGPCQQVALAGGIFGERSLGGGEADSLRDLHVVHAEKTRPATDNAQ